MEIAHGVMIFVQFKTDRGDVKEFVVYEFYKERYLKWLKGN